MIETIWRPKPTRLLTEKQRREKLQKDSEYEIAHLNLSANARAGKITKAAFEAAHTKQWSDYVEWAKANGLYEEVTPEQQLAEAEVGLDMQVEQINLIRTELKMSLLEVKERKGGGQING